MAIPLSYDRGGERMFEAFCIALITCYIPMIIKGIHFEVTKDENGKVRRTISFNKRAKEKDSDSEE